ncbi:MAG: hypothetical protein AAF705_01165 [Bacteroidota bacterium]
MIDRKDKNIRSIEIGLGLIVGYFLGAFLGKYVYGMEWDRAFLNQKLIAGLIAVGITYVVYLRRKQKQQEEEQTS